MIKTTGTVTLMTISEEALLLQRLITMQIKDREECLACPKIQP